MTRRRRLHALPLVLIFLGLLFAGLYHFLRVRQIVCYDQFGTCAAEISRPLSRYLGWPLLAALPTARVTKDLAAFPQIKSVSLYRRLPSVMVVVISLRNPVGAMGVQVLGAHVAVDQDGVVFALPSQNTLPLLISPVVPGLSSRVSADQLRALSDLNLVNTLFDTPISGSLSGSDLTVYAPQGLQIILSVANTTSNWYTPLQLLLKRSKINAKMPHKIDLRFNDAVLTY